LCPPPFRAIYQITVSSCIPMAADATPLPHSPGRGLQAMLCLGFLVWGAWDFGTCVAGAVERLMAGENREVKLEGALPLIAAWLLYPFQSRPSLAQPWSAGTIPGWLCIALGIFLIMPLVYIESAGLMSIGRNYVASNAWLLLFIAWRALMLARGGGGPSGAFRKNSSAFARAVFAVIKLACVAGGAIAAWYAGRLFILSGSYGGDPGYLVLWGLTSQSPHRDSPLSADGTLLTISKTSWKFL
jgi:hypothetical protein